LFAACSGYTSNSQLAQISATSTTGGSVSGPEKLNEAWRQMVHEERKKTEV
jgi:hypothetical protein